MFKSYLQRCLFKKTHKHEFNRKSTLHNNKHLVDENYKFSISTFHNLHKSTKKDNLSDIESSYASNIYKSTLKINNSKKENFSKLGGILIHVLLSYL